MDPVAPTERLVGVYDADGGVGVRDRLPAVYAVRSDRSVDELITRPEPAGMDGSVDRFATLLRARLAAD